MKREWLSPVPTSVVNACALAAACLECLTIAPPASIGGRVTSSKGNRTPAAIGSPTLLYLDDGAHTGQGAGREERKEILKRSGERRTGGDGVERRLRSRPENRKHDADRVHIARVRGWKLRASDLRKRTHKQYRGEGGLVELTRGPRSSCSGPEQGWSGRDRAR